MPAACDKLPTEDSDADGFTGLAGDCDDCEPTVNPAAYDIADNGVDEDCSGTADDETTACDAALALDDPDPLNMARALGLCRTAAESDPNWGVLDARFVKADGTSGVNPASHGLLDDFGPYVAVREGERMAALSSGSARRPPDPDYVWPGEAQMRTTSVTPSGFPKDSPSCAIETSKQTQANDPAALELRIRVPSNAKSFSYDLRFYTFEFPGFVCTEYNDFYVALLDSNAPNPNAQDKNISFDALNNPIGVNGALLQVCSPQTAGGKDFACLSGSIELLGNGFGPDIPENVGVGHAATGWLRTTAPVEPGEIITIRFAVWDAGDDVLASTVLLDNFRWQTTAAPGSSTVPVPR